MVKFNRFESLQNDSCKNASFLYGIVGWIKIISNLNVFMLTWAEFFWREWCFSVILRAKNLAAGNGIKHLVCKARSSVSERCNSPTACVLRVLGLDTCHKLFLLSSTCIFFTFCYQFFYLWCITLKPL